MEFTRSVGDYYETFEGTPSEIAALIDFLESKEQKINKKFKLPSILPKFSIPNLTKAAEMNEVTANKFAQGGIVKGGEQ